MIYEYLWPMVGPCQLMNVKLKFHFYVQKQRPLYLGSRSTKNAKNEKAATLAKKFWPPKKLKTFAFWGHVQKYLNIACLVSQKHFLDVSYAFSNLFWNEIRMGWNFDCEALLAWPRDAYEELRAEAWVLQAYLQESETPVNHAQDIFSNTLNIHWIWNHTDSYFFGLFLESVKGFDLYPAFPLWSKASSSARFAASWCS